MRRRGERGKEDLFDREREQKQRVEMGAQREICCKVFIIVRLCLTITRERGPYQLQAQRCLANALLERCYLGIIITSTSDAPFAFLADAPVLLPPLRFSY